MSELKRTKLYDTHVAAGATMVDFGGWDMPVQYPEGIIAEHLFTRTHCSLFDVSHMGRIIVTGPERVQYLEKVLTSDVSSLPLHKAQYCIIPAEDGSAVDDAYLYKIEEDRHMLVINAGNIDKDKAWLYPLAEEFDVTLDDQSDVFGSIAVQGPESTKMLMTLIGDETLAEMPKNGVEYYSLEGHKMLIARTGYTGEPLGYEVFPMNEDLKWLWDRLIGMGAKPAGLGARDTLRMEAGMPLYGHEMGVDEDGKNMPIFAVGLAKFAVAFTENKPQLIGREILEKQASAFKLLSKKDNSEIENLPRRIRNIQLTDRGVLRGGMAVFKGDKQVGWVTSGTMIPYYKTTGEGDDIAYTDEIGKRPIGMCYVDSDVLIGDEVEVDVRGKRLKAMITKAHLNASKAPYAFPALH
ncbi:MAG: glycine cleavage system aminomethyltransferase GcvT [Firmicutes bacterium]|nr:glycine cleavage system aminomethyltransferase GcvT [Bacillota bacterium]